MSVFGHVVHDMLFWVPATGNIGVGLSCITYNDGVRVGVSVDEALDLAPSEITSAFEHEVSQSLDMS